MSTATKRPSLCKAVADSLAGQGPVTAAQAYEILWQHGYRWAIPSRNELKSILPHIPGIRRVTPAGIKPARYEYTEGTA